MSRDDLVSTLGSIARVGTSVWFQPLATVLCLQHRTVVFGDGFDLRESLVRDRRRTMKVRWRMH